MDRKVTRSDDKSKYKRVEPDDLVYNMMRAWQGGFGTVRIAGMVSPAYVVARPRFRFSTVFVEHLLRTPNAVEEMRRHSRGVTDFRLRLYWDEFKSLYVAIPLLCEQTAITAFLDRETAKIDALVEEQQRLIELLKEKRHAVISHAVTKGLDPDVPMKESGVEWLGEVPEHWEVGSLKRACSLVRDGTHLPPTRVAEGVPLLSVRNIFDGRFGLRDDDSFISQEDYLILCRAFVPQADDVILAIVGATLGKTALIPQDLGSFHIQRSVAVFRTGNGLLPTWLHYVFQSSGFQRLLWEHVGYSAQPGIYLGTLAEFRIPLPSMADQSRITAFLECEVGEVNALIVQAEAGIALLQERRAALISAAVTGKIDVRGLVEDDEPIADVVAA